MNTMGLTTWETCPNCGKETFAVNENGDKHCHNCAWCHVTIKLPENLDPIVTMVQLKKYAADHPEMDLTIDYGHEN